MMNHPPPMMMPPPPMMAPPPGNQESKMEVEARKKVSKPKPVAEPKRTIYIQNLNEKIKIAEIKPALNGMFSQFGTILDIHIRKTIKTKGQAWIAFDNLDSAIHAVNSLNGFNFYDKPMVIAFSAKDAQAVNKYDGNFAAMRRRPKGERDRIKLEEEHRAATAAAEPEPQADQHGYYQQPDYRQQYSGYGQPPAVSQPPPQAKPKPAPSNAENPPNKILLLVGLPEDTNEELLSGIFGNLPGLVEVRLIAGRHDIAFVEYENEYQASQAKTTLQGYSFDSKNQLKIMFAKAS